MKSRSAPRLALVAVALLPFSTASCSKKRGAATTAPADGPKGIVAVTTTTMKSGHVAQTITAYGSVTAEPGAVAVLSAGVECRVRRLRVAGGESVDAGAAVIEVEPSPDARYQLLDARNAVQVAQQARATVKQRFDLKLATNGDVQSADAAAGVARQKLDDLVKRGAGEDRRVISADAAGVVAKVDVQEGQLVPAGGPLVEVVPRGQIEVRLGVEPTDVGFVKPGQRVRLVPTSFGDDDEPIDGAVRLVTRRLSPDTRLVDVFAAPGETGRLLLDSSVRGEVDVKIVSGLVVPHAALVPDEEGFSIFTVKDGHAVKHAVKVAVQTDEQAVITGDGLREGDAVVITGNLELDDKAAVAVAAPEAQPAAEEDPK